MYTLYLTLQFLYRILTKITPLLGVLGVISLLAWGTLLTHWLDPATESSLLFFGAFPLNGFLPVKPINLFLMSLLELSLSYALQNLCQKIDTYLIRNQYIKQDAIRFSKEAKNKKPTETKQTRHAIVALRLPQDSDLTPLTLEMKRFVEYNGNALVSEAGYSLIRFKELEEAVAYTQFAYLKVKEAGIPDHQFSFALDYAAVMNQKGTKQMLQIEKDSRLLCELQTPEGIVCTEAFVEAWDQKSKVKRFGSIKGKPLALNKTLTTTIMGTYLLKGTNTQKTLYGTEIK